MFNKKINLLKKRREFKKIGFEKMLSHKLCFLSEKKFLSIKTDQM